MRVVFMGTPDFAVGTLEAIIEAGYEVVAVVTQPDKPKGRSGALAMSPVKEVALKHNITVLQPVRARDEVFVSELAEYKPDVIVVVAFGQILPKSIIDMPPYGCINVHASLLPKYRGAAPIQYAVIDGCEYSGVTTMQMDEGLDTGDILLVEEVKLDAKETGGSLFDRLSGVGASLLVKT
ncbi:MAG: methionyl-tRNA formyltransferase, partial [Lachnospira sp.]|nr:methionyl-tRNA formyltransferase [Lachnospira sp.]